MRAIFPDSAFSGKHALHEIGSVLVAEAEPSLADSISRELSRTGYAVRVATDGLQALRLVKQEIPDLLILNWSLPHLGGLQLLRHVRQVLQQDNIRVLMLARDDDTNTKKCVRGLDCGADDFMTLPLSLLELSARVRALLRRLRYLKDGQPFDWTPHAIQPHFNTLWHGELILDRPERTAYLAGQSLHLSRGEFELLTCLMQDPGRCYSRAELQQSIWQQCQAPGDRSVDNIVLRLRRKLGIYRGDLETVWGVGYRLKPR